MRAYLSGPMSGYLNYNYPVFSEVAAWLRDQGGFEVISPAEMGVMPCEPGSAEYEQALATQLAIIRCTFGPDDMIALLPGWSKSKGSRAGLEAALDVGMGVLSIRILGETGSGKIFWTVSDIT